jgi:hypothetical protein
MRYFLEQKPGMSVVKSAGLALMILPTIVRLKDHNQLNIRSDTFLMYNLVHGGEHRYPLEENPSAS